MTGRQDTKLKNIVKIAFITVPGDDDGLDAISEVQYLGKETDAALIFPYGFSSRAPADSSVLLLSSGASAQNAIGIPYSSENRFLDLEEGEAVAGNYITKAKIFFKEDGSIEIEAGKDGGSIRVSNENGFFELKENGQFNSNDNFTVDP